MIITLTGTTALLMNNARLSDPDDTYARAIAVINSKKSNQTDDDRLEKSRLQFAGGMYYDPDTGPYLPGQNLIRSLRNAANLVHTNKGGKKIERGFILLIDRAPLEYNGPRDLDELWSGGTSSFVDRRIVKIPGGGRVPATRPIFTPWTASFEFELDGNEIDFDDFEAFAEKAGRAEGIGDGRRIGYGRYKAEVIK